MLEGGKEVSDGLYVLDRENEMKRELEGCISEELYGGEWEKGLKEEMLVGMGGVVLVKKVGMKKDVYDWKEGDGGLCNVEGVCE